MSGVLHGVVASLAGRVRDAFFRYVTLLLNTSATNGAQNNTFLDSSTNNFSITRNGDTTQGSFNPYMPSGYWSGFFDGTGDYLSVADNVAFEFGSGDFCVEFFAYVIATDTNGVIFVSQWSTPNRGWIFGYVNSGTTLNFDYSTTGLNSVSVSSSVTLPINQWAHFAACRSGNTLSTYMNGTRVATASVTGVTIFAPNQALEIGRNPESTSTWEMNGYISGLRIVKGSSVYDPTQTTLTVPTSPLTAITNTSLLCLQDNRFKDNSTNAFAITVNGDTRISKFAPFNPPASYSTASYGGSGYFDGTGDYLAGPSNAAFAFGTGNFTVETFWYPTSSDTTQYVYLLDATGGFTFGFEIVSVPCIIMGRRATATDLSAAYTIIPGQWVHLVAVRSGTTASLYINGSRVATGTVSIDYTVNGPVNVGAIGSLGGYELNGYLSNLRVVKGTAVYDPTQTTLTVPTAPLTAITNTSLLLNFTNAGIYDAATINNGQTVGNAQVSTTQAKWSPTSMAFDGTGDYVTVIDKPELRIGTGDFTIEGWVYLNATGVAYGLVSKGTATTGWSVNVTSGNKLQFSYTATQLTGATSLASGTWYYFAVVRSGTASGNLRVILNGATDATSAGAVNDNFNQTNVLYVGADRVAGAVLNGYLQDVRITNGYARTTSTPTAAFPTL